MDWRDFLEEWAFTITLGLLLVGILLMLSGCSTLDALKAQTKNTVEVLDEAGADNINAAKICNRDGKILRGEACSE